MPEPTTRGELEQTTFFKAGAEAKERGRKLKDAIAMMRFGTWQYDAFIAGFDSKEKPLKQQPMPAQPSEVSNGGR